MDRLQQKNELFMKLGALLNPLQRLVEHPDQYNEQERAETIARYCAEWQKLAEEFRGFCSGQAGHLYEVQRIRFFNALDEVRVGLAYEKELSTLIGPSLAKASSAISDVPIPKNSEILEAGSPFTAFCKIKDLVECDATHEIIWVDAYMNLNIFHRFLRGVAPNVVVTLVTEEPGANAGKRNRARWDEFLDVSRLFAQERGPSLYRLVVHQSGILHDRWLLLDSKRLFHLGGSAKDAANNSYFTIGRLDASPENVNMIERHVNDGDEYFGFSISIHK